MANILDLVKEIEKPLLSPQEDFFIGSPSYKDAARKTKKAKIEAMEKSILEVFGEKSKDADDIKEANGSFSSVLSGTGGQNIFGQEVAPLTEEDLLTMVMGISGGIKAPKRMFGSIPKSTKKMPKTQYQYESPEFQPNPTGTFRDQTTGRLVNVETTPQRLFRELTESDLDTYEFQMKLAELDNIAPEMADKVMSALGY